MQPTNSENTDEGEVPEEFAAAWANVLLDLNEKQQPTSSQEADSNSSTEEQQCESTSKPTPK